MCAAVFLPAIAWAVSYDVTVTFTAGVGATSHNLYVDDCGPAPVGLAVGTVITGQTFPALILVDGTYEFCVRSENAAGESPDPGQVATVTITDIPLPGPIGNLNVTVACPTGSCSVSVTIN